VPRGRYSNLSVRREVREELEKLRSELKINDLSDLLILLVRTYRDYTNTISKIEEILTNSISKFEELLTNTVSKAVREALSSHTNTISKTSTSADSERTTIPDLITRMYKHYIQHNINPNIQPNNGEHTTPTRNKPDRAYYWEVPSTLLGNSQYE
jgi:membrane-associated HD superfamily phosphohydrolase